MTGMLIAKCMGLIEYDNERFFKYVLGLLRENKASSNDLISSTADVLNDFVHEH